MHTETISAGELPHMQSPEPGHIKTGLVKSAALLLEVANMFRRRSSDWLLSVFIHIFLIFFPQLSETRYRARGLLYSKMVGHYNGGNGMLAPLCHRGKIYLNGRKVFK